MAKVNVVIVDATGNKEQKVGLPDDIKCGIIMVKLVEKIKLPSVGPDGNPISYKFIKTARWSACDEVRKKMHGRQENADAI